MDFENPLVISDISRKLRVIETACHQVLSGKGGFDVPEVIGRDVEVREISELPAKSGLGSGNGQARMLHDLASIELQAMEMSFRTLVDFPDAPKQFRDQLADIVLDEARHLRLCLDQIRNLGCEWGDWPVHTGLWRCLSNEDSLLDRLFIVHRFLEGSGLDAGDKILRRLKQVGYKGTVHVVKVIAEEEVGHVQFGSRWYKEVCKIQKRDASLDFLSRSESLFRRLPRRLEPMNQELRKSAGFSAEELSILKSVQDRQLKEKNIRG